MSNQKKETVTEQQQVQEVKTEQQPTPTEQQTTTVPEQKQGFKGWLKNHWKAVVGGVTGALALGGSAVIAYKKGKAAGIMSVPQETEQEDYSLNPNE